jgi:hypothetical protein
VEVYLHPFLLVLVDVSYDLSFSSSATVAALVCWSFGVLARRLLVYLL